MDDVYQVVNVPMDLIYSDDTFNCRGRLAPMDVADLLADIKARGLDTHITIRPYDKVPGKTYRIVTGHRRYLACKLLGWKDIPCRIRTDLKELEENILNLTENIKRQDLNMLQEAHGLKAFKKARWTESVIAAQVGMSRGWVQVRLMLLDLPEDIQAEAAAGILNQEQIRQLYTIRDRVDEMYAIVRTIKDRRIAGDSARIVLKKEANPHRKEIRKPEAIFEFQETVNLLFGPSFYTKLLGWCAGANSDYEIHRALSDEARLHGKFYQVPKELTDKL